MMSHFDRHKDDGLREATGLIHASFVSISDLASSPVIPAIPASVATGTSQQQNSSHSAELRQK